MKTASRYIFGFLGGMLLFAIVTTWGPVLLRPWRAEEQPVAGRGQAPQANSQVERPQQPANPQFPLDIFKMVQQQLTTQAGPPPGNPPAGNAPGWPRDIADPISRAIAQLSSDDWSSQEAACKLLAGMKVDGQRQAEVLLAVKKMINARVRFSPRAQAVRVLTVWGTTEEVPYLLRLLDDTDYGVQEAVIVALGKMKDIRAADMLALRLNSAQRGIAGEALKEIGPAAEGIVREQLKSTDRNARIEAIKVLKVIGSSASQKDLIELANDSDQDVAVAAREALSPKLRPPLAGPKQTITINIHVADYNAWPDIEARVKALADSPMPMCKANRSGEYMWVTLSPVEGEPEKIARKIDFGKIISVYTDRRLIYVESGR
jgi:hypothetical protein